MQITALLFGAFFATVEVYPIINALIEVNLAITGLPMRNFVQTKALLFGAFLAIIEFYPIKDALIQMK